MAIVNGLYPFVEYKDCSALELTSVVSLLIFEGLYTGGTEPIGATALMGGTPIVLHWYEVTY